MFSFLAPLLLKFAPLGKWLAPVWQFIRRYWKEVLIILAVLYVINLRDNLKDAERQLLDREALIHANQEAGKAIDDCIAVNKKNAGLRYELKLRAEEAERRVHELESTSNDEIVEIERESSIIRDTADQSCRTLSDDLPDDILDWVWDSAGNSHRIQNGDGGKG